MGKRIIFCADGTWDSPPNSTNVYKLFKAVPPMADQIAFYDDGVGCDGTPLEKLAGAAMGDGIFQKVKDGYTKIAHVYLPGDEIFIFGFSRGAYTARSLAGMIAVCGLPPGGFQDSLVADAFQAYRNPSQRAAFAAKYPTLDDAKIKMIGVWDTVGALGLPAIAGGVDPALYGFLDTDLHPDLLNAFQALAIDEKRAEFPPTLWKVPVPAISGQTLEQVWFSGVHCDVGGGYPETGLSDITFSWMIQKAQKLGLILDPKVAAQYTSPMDSKNAIAQIHDSWSVLWLFPKIRDITTISILGNSVGVRCQHVSGYQPKNVAIVGSLPAPTYGAERVVV